MPYWVVTVPAMGFKLIARVPVVDLQKTIAMENAKGVTDTNCEEFNFDDGDCNLIDCLGTHFSEEFCIEYFNAGCTTGEATWIGDGYCDEGDNDLELNFNCADWEYDGGDCESTSGRIIYGH
jgi:hypothetical protein